MTAEVFQPLIEEIPTSGVSVPVDPSLINARFVDVPVVAIESCELELDYFDASADSAFFRIGDQQYSPVGCLKRVIAVIRFRSPVSVDPRSLMVRFDRANSIASRQATIRIGMIDTLGAISSHKCGDQYLDILQPYLISTSITYTIRVPLIYDQVIQLPQMPLVDRIQTKDQYVLHYTLNLPARNWPGGRMSREFKIRIKVIQMLGFAQVVSISDSLIDSPRLTEAWANFKDWVSTCCRSVTSQQPPAQPQPHHEVVGNEFSEDQEYYAKVISQSGQVQPFSMPPPQVSTEQNYYFFNPTDAAQPPTRTSDGFLFQDQIQRNV